MNALINALINALVRAFSHVELIRKFFTKSKSTVAVLDCRRYWTGVL
jgi:hypothetical protein